MSEIMAARSDIETINDIINPLLGHKAWNVKLGIGSFITIEFGNPIPTARQKTRGEWYLWIYCCGWYLENQNGILAGSEDQRDRIRQKITILEDHTIEDIVVSSPVFETNFVFDGGLVLHTFPLTSIDPYKYWMLFTPQGRVLVLGPAGQWSYELSSKSRS